MEVIIEGEAKEFIQRLPELSISPPSAHLIMLAVRSRKARELLNQKFRDLVIEREIIRAIPNWKDRYFNSIYNLSILQNNGRYEYKDIIIPKEALGIFATLSPRNVTSAIADVMKENINLLALHNKEAMVELSKQNSRYFGALHSHKTREVHYATIDIDIDDTKLLQEVLDKVSSIPKIMVTNTSRGFHVVLDITKPSDAKAFYEPQGIKYSIIEPHKDVIDFQRDSQEPVPGTLYCKKGGEIHYVKILQ